MAVVAVNVLALLAVAAVILMAVMAVTFPFSYG
jgi:hypothetical protein